MQIISTYESYIPIYIYNTLICLPDLVYSDSLKSFLLECYYDRQSCHNQILSSSTIHNKMVILDLVQPEFE